MQTIMIWSIAEEAPSPALTPIAAPSLTCGWSPTTFSTSIEETFSPRRRM